MKNISISENEYFELLRYKDIVRSLEQMIHEPEFKKDFIERVKEAEERVKKGEKVKFSSADEMEKYLDESEE